LDLIKEMEFCRISQMEWEKYLLLSRSKAILCRYLSLKPKFTQIAQDQRVP
jgi:hypothetical protein